MWWRQHWGSPCKRHDPTAVIIGGHRFVTDGRMVPAWEAWEMVRARHGYVVNPPYPDGDSGMYNCRHIGNDPERPMSVHAWAGAIDVNWNSNPDGSRLITDMPKPMRDDLHALRTRAGAPVFRWGGDWDRDPRTDHSYYDAMHWELVCTPAELASGVIDPRHQEDDMPLDDNDKAWLRALATEIAGPRRNVDEFAQTGQRRDVWRWAGEAVTLLRERSADTIAAKVIAGIEAGDIDEARIRSAVRDGVNDAMREAFGDDDS